MKKEEGKENIRRKKKGKTIEMKKEEGKENIRRQKRRMQ